ncbi:MAG: helix-turn-helix domain-containing protein [Parcubacteria group bacterium]|jgi:sugar-specific transcriptional regulator TrmB
MLERDLEKLGLDDKEAKIYLALLELGEANIQQIAKKSGVKRTTVYDIIESLKEKGLLSSATRHKKITYSAEDPRTLEEKLDERKNTLKRIMPELLSIANAMDKKPKIRFFEGSEGIKEVYKDTLKYPSSELLAWVSDEAVTVFDKDFLEGYYLPKRIEKKIWVRAIGTESTEMKNYKNLDEKSLRKTKIISANQFPIHVEINLYGKNKIAVMSFSEKIGLIVESQKIFTTLKSIFEMNWNSIA